MCEVTKKGRREEFASLTGTGSFSLSLARRPCFPARRTFWMQPSGWTFDRECDSVRANILRHSPNTKVFLVKKPWCYNKILRCDVRSVDVLSERRLIFNSMVTEFSSRLSTGSHASLSAKE